MATIHKGSNALSKKANTYLTLGILFWIPPIAYFIAFFQGFHFNGIFHLLPIVPGWIGTYFWRKYSTLRAGLSGEERTTEILANLPEGYEVYSSVQLSTEEGRAELDHVIVGKNGVFVVEVKNHNGTITGNEEDRSWTQHKVGRKGGEYSKEMRNPVKQVRRQVHILSKHLSKNGTRVWVEGSVFFSNPQAEVYVETKKTPVFTSPYDLHEFLTNYKPRYNIKEAELETVKKLVS